MEAKWVGSVVILLLAAVGYLWWPENPSGYQPAESLAGEMTPEWEEFAEQVDRACATNFNQGQIDLARMESRAASEGWSNSQTEATYRYIQAAHQQATHDEIAALGAPPAEPKIFNQWLWNVGRRAEIMRRAGRKWEFKDGDGTRWPALRITALKIDADWLGQHFGLRICTSNGPMNNRDDDEDYLEEVNGACVERADNDYRLWTQGKFDASVAAGNTLAETLIMAAVAPPVEQYELRSRILASKRALDRYQVRHTLRRFVGRHTSTAEEAKINRRLVVLRDEVARFGLPDCAWPKAWPGR